MKKVNGIYVTKCVSFPRSGHNWLASVLNSYFGSRFNYCEMYLNPEHKIDICDKTNFQKSHDFDLKESIHPEIKYVIQIRNFEDVSLSYYRSQKMNVKTIWDEKTNIQMRVDKPHVDIHSTDYIEYKNLLKIYYDAFVNKWTKSKIENSIIVTYESMIDNPIQQISSVISFITDENIDINKLTKII